MTRALLAKVLGRVPEGTGVQAIVLLALRVHLHATRLWILKMDLQCLAQHARALLLQPVSGPALDLPWQRQPQSLHPQAHLNRGPEERRREGQIH